MNKFQKIIWRSLMRQMMISNGPARGMILIRHDDGAAVPIVIPLHAFDALWNQMMQASTPVDIDDAED
jgi:hypothetical protein